MASPSVRGTIRATQGTTGSATPVINLPTSVVAGDTLIVHFGSAGGGAIGWPNSDWHELIDESPHAADDQIGIAWKLADGTEDNTSITLSSANARFIGLAACIQDAADPTVTPPEITSAATGSGTNPDAPPISPAGGMKEYLIMALHAMEGEAVASVSPHPANYTPGTITNSGTAGGAASNIVGGMAVRAVNASTEDPGAWSFDSGQDDWAAYTVAFYPVPVATKAPPPPRLHHQPEFRTRRKVI